jgi:glucose/arabinose dehydrogenase
MRAPSLRSELLRAFGSAGRRGPELPGIVCLAVTLLLSTAGVRADFPALKLQPVSTGELVTPVGMAVANDGSNRLFIVDQRGKIQIMQNGVLNPTPFLDLSSKLVPQRTNASGQLSFDERGLLGLAFHPDYSVNGAPGQGKFYVFYSESSPNSPGTSANPVDCRSVVAEYSVSANPNVANPVERRLFSMDKPQFNHNAGQIAFGPDKMLYIGIGDGGGANDNGPGHTGGGPGNPMGVLGNAQDKSNLMGKILRIDPQGTNMGAYGVPGDNPYVGVAGVREEIYANGLRNPWRFSFDDRPGGTNRLFAADVGQGLYEEVNIIEKGGNYGWRIKEGFHDFDPSAPNPDGDVLIDPIAEYAHPGVPGDVVVGVSATGGFIYRGDAIPELQGKYIFGDWSESFGTPSGTILGLEETGPGQWGPVTKLQLADGNPIPMFINSFGQDEFGELYVLGSRINRPGLDNAGLPAGMIFKIVPEPATGVGLLLMAGLLYPRRRR